MVCNYLRPEALCNIEYPSETPLKPKSHKNSFSDNICRSCPVILKFCTEHGRDTAVLCAKFQDNWIIKMDVMGERDFVRFEFKICFRRISCIAQHLWSHETCVNKWGPWWICAPITCKYSKGICLQILLLNSLIDWSLGLETGWDHQWINLNDTRTGSTIWIGPGLSI